MTDFKDIAGITIKKGKFNAETKLELFKTLNKDNEVIINNSSVIYAKNGEGKSTIAKAINEYVNNNGESIDFIDKDGEKILLNNQDKNNIFVYNEDYIEQTVKFKEEGLDTIVLLGKNVQYDSQKEKLNDDKKINDKKINENIDKISQCEKDQTDYIKIRKNILREGWADRGREIKGSSNKQPVKNTSIEKILKSDLLKDEDIQDCKEEFNKLLTIYRNTHDISSPFDVLNMKLPKYDKDLRELLLSDKINGISNNVINSELFNIENIQKLINNNDNVCPLCLRDISDEGKKELEAKIRDLFGNGLNSYQNKLKKMKIDINREEEKIKILSEKYSFFNDQVFLIESKFTKLKKVMKKINKLIDIKCQNPKKELVDLDEILLNFNNVYDDCQKEINILSDNIEEVNQKINEKRKLYNKLCELNNKLGHKEIEDISIKITKKENEINQYKKNIQDLEISNDEISNKINEYNIKEKNIDIALNLINQNLKCIFLSGKRLHIEYNSQLKKYTILSKGKSVNPNSISTGEKNIIALAYFFTEIYKMKQLNNEKQIFLIIDDPISSFDLNNKFGIIAFLNAKLSEYTKQNQKILILTHDYLVACDSLKIRCRKELSNNQIYSLSGQGSYSMMMNELYSYSINPNKDAELYIGNMARKVFNAYSTFNYGCNIDDLINNKKLVLRDDIFTKDEKKYFESMRYLVLLNPLSHTENRAKLIDDPNFNTEYSTHDIQLVIRNVLIYIYKLSPDHIIRNISIQGKYSKKEIIDQFDTWVNEINN